MQKWFVGCLLMAWMSLHTCVMADQTWTGAVDNNFFNDNNWTPNPPGFPIGTLAIFPTPLTSGRYNPTLSISITENVSGVTFSAGGTPIPYTLTIPTGNVFSISTSGIDNQTSVPQNIIVENSSQLDVNGGNFLGPIILNVTGGSICMLNTAGVGVSTAVSVTGSSRLSTNADYTLGSLSSDTSSLVNPNFNLEVGSLGTSTTVAGGMLGPGSVTKVGAGTLTFSTFPKGYSGPTTINGGTLLLKTVIQGDAIVNNGGTLAFAGLGAIQGNCTINSGGIISSGNSISTLIVFGNYTQNPGSFYFVELTGSNQSDIIGVNGTATLNGGTVQVISGTPTVGGVYDILHADGGVTGTFSSLVINSPIRVGLVYTPFDVFIEVLGTNFAAFGRTPNQRHTAQQLDSITAPTSDETTVIDALAQLSVPQLQHALDLMSGEQYANLLPIEQQVTRRFVRRLYDPLRELLTGCLCCTPCRCDEYGIQPWLQVEGGRGFLRRDFNGRGFKDDYYSISYGAQTMLEMLDACWVVGIAGDYSHDRIRHNLSGHSKLRTSEAALYGAVFRPDFYVLADLVGGQSSCSLRRHIQFGDINRKTRAHPDLWNILGYAELGYNFCTCNVLLQPFVAFENGYYSRKRVRERGANSLDLIIKKETVTSFDSRMGFHFTSCFCDQYILSADIAWQHRFNSLGDNLRNQFIDFGDTFTIRGPRQGRDGIDAAIYLGAQVREWLTFFAEFNGEKWDRYSTWGALGGFEARF